jgi:hypothetical protein
MKRSARSNVGQISRRFQSGRSRLRTARRQINAVIPSAFTIEAAEIWALERARELPPEPFRLSAYFHIDYIVQQVPEERKTRYIARMAQAESYGIAFGLAPALPDLDPDFVGKDVRQILKGRLWRDAIDRTALVDLVMAHLPQSASKNVRLGGAERDKYLDRGRIFADEADRILRRKTLKGTTRRVLVIGASAGIIRALKNRGFQVSATDLSPTIIGTVLGSVTVRSGRLANASLIKEADLAIITGMTLPNRTLARLMKLAQQSNTSTMIWAITGKNFGRYYTEHGVDCVISDLAAFHRLPGPASIEIWRRDAS